MIKPWLFEFFHEKRAAPGGALSAEDVRRHFDEYLALWDRCEERGFEGLFFSEHHFGAGYSPSPNLLVATMAQRTTTLRLGVLGTASPYATPWRVVEEFAMLDQLTGGRFEPGVVSGIPPEYGLVGITPPEALRRHGEILDVVDQALSDGVLQHRGEHWALDSLRVVPPFRRSGIRPWTAVRSVASAMNAGRRGWKMCAGFASTREIAEITASYRGAAAEAGHDVGPDDIAIRRLVTFVETDGDGDDGVRSGKRHLLDVLTASAGALPPWAALLDSPEPHEMAVSSEEFVSGTPESVAEKLIEQCRTVGAGHCLVMLGALEPAELDGLHQTFSETVIPRLRTA